MVKQFAVLLNKKNKYDREISCKEHEVNAFG